MSEMRTSGRRVDPRHAQVTWITDENPLDTAVAMHPVLLGSTYKLRDVAIVNFNTMVAWLR